MKKSENTDAVARGIRTDSVSARFSSQHPVVDTDDELSLRLQANGAPRDRDEDFTNTALLTLLVRSGLDQVSISFRSPSSHHRVIIESSSKPDRDLTELS
jgi:hypothetical protein